MAFVVQKTIPLDQFEGWKECSITFNSPRYEDIKSLQADSDEKAAETGMELLKNLFVKGKGWNGTEVVDIKNEELGELPLVILNYLFTELAGPLSPKSDGS